MNLLLSMCESFCQSPALVRAAYSKAGPAIHAGDVANHMNEGFGGVGVVLCSAEVGEKAAGSWGSFSIKGINSPLPRGIGMGADLLPKHNVE